MPTYTAPGVYVEEMPSSSKVLTAGPTAVPAFVGFTEKFPADNPADIEGLAPRLITSWSEYEKLYGSFVKGAMLPFAVYGYFQNGGSMAYIVRVPNSEPAGKPSTAALPAADRALGSPVLVESVQPDAVLSLAIEAEEPTTPDDPPSFTMKVMDGGTVIESYPRLTLSGDTDAATVVNKESTRIKVKLEVPDTVDLAAQLDLMRPGNYPLVRETPVPVPVTGRAFSGSATTRRGINGLAIADDVTMVVVPDLVTAATKEDGSIDLGLWKAVQTSLIAHCEQYTNRMALLDAPPGMSPQEIRGWRSEVAMFDSAFATMYYPWIRVENPIGENGETEILIPPSGHVAGVWARVDQTRGVWKAPANETIQGVLDVERPVTQTEQGLLNPIGINCIRPFGTRGIRIWGARTLSSDTDWNYINVRRLFNMVEKSILDGTNWAVFEPNSPPLWAGVTQTVSAFLTGLWRQGALFGTSASEAFYVRCDASTNPSDSIDAGKLIVEVGLAPVKPAEFVIFRIAQHKQVAG